MHCRKTLQSILFLTLFSLGIMFGGGDSFAKVSEETIVEDEVKEVIMHEKPSLEYPKYKEFGKIPDETIFSDITKENDRYESVYFLKQNQIIEGYSDGEVKLDRKLNRAEFVKILLEAKKRLDPNISISLNAKYTFPDNMEAEWYAKYVSTAKRLNIVRGYRDGKFRPEKEISWSEALKVIIETLDIDIEEENFPEGLDTVQDEWYAKYISTIHTFNLSHDLKNFKDEKEFSHAITRAEAFDILARSFYIRQKERTVFQKFDLSSLIFEAENGVIQTKYKSPYYLPVIYTENIQSVKGNLYKVSEEILRESFLGSENDNKKTQINASLINKMTFLSHFESDLTSIAKENNPSNIHDQIGIMNLPIRQKGIYFLKMVGNGDAEVFLVVSDIAILSREGKLKNLVWVVDGKKQKLVSDAKVTFYSKTPEVKQLAESMTNEDGVAEAYLSNPEIITAKTENDFAIIISKKDEIKKNTEGSGPYTFYGYSDRPFYEEKDKVYIKGIVRKFEESQYIVPDDTVTMVLKVIRKNNRENVSLLEKNIVGNTFGTFASEFTVEKNTKAGVYEIVLEVNNQEYVGGEFEILSSQEDQYLLKLSTDKEEYFRGDFVYVSVESEDNMGRPVKEEKLEYKVYKVDINDPANKEEWSTGVLDLDLQGKSSFSFQAGENTIGEHDFTFETYNPQNDHFIFLIEVLIKDSKDETVTVTKNILAYNGPFTIEFRGNSHGYVDEPYKMDVRSFHHTGTPYSGAFVQYEITNDYKKTKECFFKFNVRNIDFSDKECVHEEIHEIVKEGKKFSDGVGGLNIEFDPQMAGKYTLKVIAQDDDKVTVKNIFHFEILDQNIKAVSDEVKILFDRYDGVYIPSKTAKILVKTGIQKGNALISIGKSDIEKYQIIPFDTGIFVYLLDITDADIPNIQINVDVWGHDEFLSDTKNIKVSPTLKKLNVDLQTDRWGIRAKDTSIWRINVTDEEEIPVVSEFSFALIDKKYLQVQKFDIDSILSQIYRSRTYSIIRKQTHLYDLRSFSQTQIETEKPEFKITKFTKDILAESLEKTAYFQAKTTTDSLGRATVNIVPPNKVVTWSAVIIAISEDGKMGAAEAELMVSKEVSINPILPKLVGIGSEFDIQALITSYRTGRKEFWAEVRKICPVGSPSRCQISSIGGRERKRISHLESEIITWKYTVPDDVESGDDLVLEFYVYEDDKREHNDTISIKIPVR